MGRRLRIERRLLKRWDWRRVTEVRATGLVVLKGSSVVCQLRLVNIRSAGIHVEAWQNSMLSLRLHL